MSEVATPQQILQAYPPVTKADGSLTYSPAFDQHFGRIPLSYEYFTLLTTHPHFSKVVPKVTLSFKSFSHHNLTGFCTDINRFVSAEKRLGRKELEALWVAHCLLHFEACSDEEMKAFNYRCSRRDVKFRNREKKKVFRMKIGELIEHRMIYYWKALGQKYSRRMDVVGFTEKHAQKLKMAAKNFEAKGDTMDVDMSESVEESKTGAGSDEMDVDQPEQLVIRVKGY